VTEKQIESYFDWHQRLVRKKLTEVKKREKEQSDLGNSIGLTPEQFKFAVRQWRERQKAIKNEKRNE